MSNMPDCLTLDTLAVPPKQWLKQKHGFITNNEAPLAILVQNLKRKRSSYVC